MWLTELEKRELAVSVANRLEVIIQQPEFRLAYQSGWISPDDLGTVYRKTLRAIERKPPTTPLSCFVSFVMTKETQRYFRAILAKKRKQKEQPLPFDDAILKTNPARRHPIPTDPAAVAEQRDLHEKVRSLITRLPTDEAAIVRAWMGGKHGEGAIESAGRKMGIKRNAAYQLFQSALVRLRLWWLEIDANR